MFASEPSRQTTATIAGYLYLVMALTNAIGLMYVPSKILVPGDVDLTIKNILEQEFIFRAGMASQLIATIVSVYLALALNKLLKEVDSYQAKVMVIFVCVQVPVVILLETLNLSALMVIKGKLITNLQPFESSMLAYLFVRIHGSGLLLLEIFWGLWLFPLGMLFYKSGFMPKWLGVLLLIASVGYTLDSMATVVVPAARIFLRPFSLTASGIAELSTILWLIIKGVKRNMNGEFK